MDCAFNSCTGLASSSFGSALTGTEIAAFRPMVLKGMERRSGVMTTPWTSEEAERSARTSSSRLALSCIASSQVAEPSTAEMRIGIS